MYTYIFINFLTIFIPLILSFEGKVTYYKKWKYVFFSLLIPAIVFILWDIYFTYRGIWGFNPAYLLGIKIFHLPIEEILFFFCVPFSCLFIYELVCRFQKREVFGPYLKPMLSILALFLFLLGLWNLDKIYTTSVFLSLSIFLMIHIFLIKRKYLDYFLQMYVITFIPFLIVNGILTNGLRFIDAGPVVWYNNAENLSLRIIGIPIEDFFYSMFLLLMNVTCYEYIKEKI